jgi:hypothetical protein
MFAVIQSEADRLCAGPESKNPFDLRTTMTLEGNFYDPPRLDYV